MKKLFVLASILGALSGCASTQDSSEVTALKNEIAELKKVQRQVAIKVGLAELVRPEKIELSSEGIWIGSESADVVMLEFTDLHCPYCKKFQKETWPKLKEQFVDTNELAVLARELPLSNIHPKAPFAAVMLRCASQQGQYEAVKEQLFELGSAITDPDIADVIKENQLDEEQFNTCLADTKTHNLITNSLNDAIALGLATTPVFIIGKKEGNYISNYEIVMGAKSVEDFTTVIERVKSSK